MKSPTVRLHVVALKAFALGGVFSAALAIIWLNSSNSTIFRLAVYGLATSIFHMLEFLTTAYYNTAEVDDDSFILTDRDLHLVVAASVVETVTVHYFFNYSTYSLNVGVLVVVVGQGCRTLAMATAGESFNHYVQREHAEKHKLVTSGIYRFLRHPSYFGYFWWYVGMQIILGNWVMAAVGTYKLHGFFKARIQYEEEFLRSFFPDYSKYAAATRVFIPGIA